MSLGEFRETGDIIHISIGEIWSRTDKLETMVNPILIVRGLIL